MQMTPVPRAWFYMLFAAVKKPHKTSNAAIRASGLSLDRVLQWICYGNPLHDFLGIHWGWSGYLRFGPCSWDAELPGPNDCFGYGALRLDYFFGVVASRDVGHVGLSTF